MLCVHELVTVPVRVMLGVVEYVNVGLEVREIVKVTLAVGTKVLDDVAVAV